MTNARTSAPEDLIQGVLDGDRRALARAISIVEGQGALRARLLKELYPPGHRASICGITGPPGAGKSTLVERLAHTELEEHPETRVGVVAVDPTSPFTGGALLGDRIRMPGLAVHPRAFIRSMATRGSRGGLARAAREVAVLMGAAGSDRVLMETVGVGQVELDVAEAADTTVVVLVPESGDGIQAMKAGLMEIGDVFVINKADREGAEGLRVEVEQVLHMRPGEGWSHPVLKTIASTGEGTAEVIEAIASHRAWLTESGEGRARRQRRTVSYVKEIVQETLSRRLWEMETCREQLDRRTADILAGQADPFAVAEEILSASGMLAAIEGE
ncbi:MAG: methylmalonyl Co-A mutase-associated GTPase MeaB [bacterium]